MDSIDELFSLTSAIDEVYSAEGPHSLERSPNTTSNQPSESVEISAAREGISSVYHRYISQRFPELEPSLLEILAAQNAIRHKRIRELEEVAIRERENAKRLEKEVSDSGYGSSQRTRPTIPMLPEIIETEHQTGPFNDARSETSLGTTNSLSSGGVCIPKAPVELQSGIEFDCSICFKYLRGVDTRLKWKYAN